MVERLSRPHASAFPTEERHAGESEQTAETREGEALSSPVPRRSPSD
jgi:hypothetical protein